MRGLVVIAAASDPVTIPTEGPRCECWPPGSSDGVATFTSTVAARPAAVRALRRGLRGWIAEAGVGMDTAEAMVLLADEAVTNAVEHATLDGPCTVSLLAGPRTCGDGVAILVRDDGRWRPPPDDRGFRGRGVTLMGRLAGRCGITTSQEGTVVRMCWPAA